MSRRRSPPRLRDRLVSREWWLRTKDGRLVVGQAPNPPLYVWLVASVVRWAGLAPDHEQLWLGIGRGALIVWGLDELVRGVNPWRRLLGAVVLGAQLVALAGDLD